MRIRRTRMGSSGGLISAAAVLVSAPAGVLGLVQEKAAELSCLLREGEDRRDPGIFF